MTLTFKDERGVECALRVVASDGSDERLDGRPATHEDLLRALGLSEGGPTDEELDAIEEHFEQTYTGTLAGQLREIRRAQVAAGAASRQAEIDRLTAERDALQHTAREKELDALLFEERAQRKRERSERRDAESELTATKARVAELEALPAPSRLEKVERDRWETMWRDAEQRAEAAKEKLAEVERERDVEKARAIAFDDEARESAAELQAQRVVTIRARRNEMESERTAVQLRSKLAEVERERDKWSDLHSKEGYRAYQLEEELRRARPVVEAVIAWKAAHAAWMKADKNASTRDIVAAEIELNEALQALASAGTDADRTEAPRAEAGKSGPAHTCMFTATTFDGKPPPSCPGCQARFAAESKPEPQPSVDTRWLALPWRLDGKRLYDRLGKPLLALLPAAPPEALAYALERCNAPEPSASVARSEVEAIADAWARYQRRDWSQEEFEGFIAERFETSSPGYALASAGTDADSEREPNMSDSRGSATCPICGHDQPHAHVPNEIQAWLLAQAQRFGYCCIAFAGNDPRDAFLRSLLERLQGDAVCAADAREQMELARVWAESVLLGLFPSHTYNTPALALQRDNERQRDDDADA